MAVDLMGGWGNSAGGSFWDDEEESGGGAGQTTKNSYIEVTTQSDTNNGEQDASEKLPNPFDTFQQEEDVKIIVYMYFNMIIYFNI